ncbi:hypothetical protein NIT60_05570 [Mammaliicoccus sciuri]|nr:hypothetical protein NIT60_05570 [Mammaliicoccus sciuri]
MSQSPLGFRLSLAFWIVLGIIALILWIPKASKGAKLERQDKLSGSTKSTYKIEYYEV